VSGEKSDVGEVGEFGRSGYGDELAGGGTVGGVFGPASDHEVEDVAGAEDVLEVKYWRIFGFEFG
jgi:hypothetical protein